MKRIASNNGGMISVLITSIYPFFMNNFLMYRALRSPLRQMSEHALKFSNDYNSKTRHCISAGLIAPIFATPSFKNKPQKAKVNGINSSISSENITKVMWALSIVYRVKKWMLSRSGCVKKA
jgi:hypothetical protein